MANRAPMAENEWYHCYNRGVDKRKVFLDASDYTRFLMLLYVANGTKPLRISDIATRNLSELINTLHPDRGETLVEVGAFCLMPNHIHFALKQLCKSGIALFMQKVFTGYTVYFNKKYNRSGPLFAGVFKSKHLYNDRYFKRAWSYIHLNPVELFESKWKQGKGDTKKIKLSLEKYEYSSLQDFSKNVRPHYKILGNSVFELFDSFPNTKEMLEEAQAYYTELPTALGGPSDRVAG